VRRREFIAFLGGAAARPLAARAQAAMPVIGILHSQTEASEAERMSAIQRGLQEAGFVVGRNVSIEHRFADGRNDRLPALAVELVQRKVNVIFANTTPPAYAAKAATSTIPIVFVTGVDPVEVGLVASMNRPGANVTGVTFLSNKLVAKRLELLSAVTPVGSPIGMLAAQRNPNTETDVKDALTAAQMLKRTLTCRKYSCRWRHRGRLCRFARATDWGIVRRAAGGFQNVDPAIGAACGAPCVADELFEQRLRDRRRLDELRT